MSKRIEIPPDVDMRDAVEQIRRECRLNGYKVVDHDLDGDGGYVIIKKIKARNPRPKPRFF